MKVTSVELQDPAAAWRCFKVDQLRDGRTGRRLRFLRASYRQAEVICENDDLVQADL